MFIITAVLYSALQGSLLRSANSPTSVQQTSRWAEDELMTVCLFGRRKSTIMIRAHSLPRQNLTNSAANLVNSAAHRGKANEIPRLTAVTQLNFRGLIKS